MESINKCTEWTKNDPMLIEYHDKRWCKPCHNDKELFAMLCLEGQQAGLSWTTIIHKEEAIRKAFDDFDFNVIASYSDKKVDELMMNEGIIRNRMKIRSVIQNAKALIGLISDSDYKSFDEYIWHFTEGKQVVHHFSDLSEMPAKDELSEKISKDLKRRGFSFVGPVIIYSYLQGIGVYDDHLDGCPSKLADY